MEKLVSVNDLGVTMGYGLFETLRIYNSIPFLVEEHLERLMKSCRELSFVNVPGRETLKELLFAYIKNAGLHSRAVRLSITYGSDAEGIAPCVFITDRAIAYEPVDYEKGIRVGISSYRKNEYSPIVQYKTFNQLEHIISLKRCNKGNLKECLFLNTSGYLCEGSKSNLFFVRGAKVFTPALDCGILPGITREAVIYLLKQQGIDVITGKYITDDLDNCDEAFCTNSLMEVMPIVRVNERGIGDGNPGPLARLALSLYRRCIDEYIARPFGSRGADCQ